LKHPVSAKYYDDSLGNDYRPNDFDSIFKWGWFCIRRVFCYNDYKKTKKTKEYLLHSIGNFPYHKIYSNIIIRFQIWKKIYIYVIFI
jgi:hypothetical protein